MTLNPLEANDYLRSNLVKVVFSGSKHKSKGKQKHTQDPGKPLRPYLLGWHLKSNYTFPENVPLMG